MKKVFTIHPALFVLTPNPASEPILYYERGAGSKTSFVSQDSCFVNGNPQTFSRNCKLNADGTIISIQYNPIDSHYPGVNLPGSIFSTLEPQIWMGRKYTLTYIEVSN